MVNKLRVGMYLILFVDLVQWIQNMESMKE